MREKKVICYGRNRQSKYIKEERYNITEERGEEKEKKEEKEKEKENVVEDEKYIKKKYERGKRHKGDGGGERKG